MTQRLTLESASELVWVAYEPNFHDRATSRNLRVGMSYRQGRLQDVQRVACTMKAVRDIFQRISDTNIRGRRRHVPSTRSW